MKKDNFEEDEEKKNNPCIDCIHRLAYNDNFCLRCKHIKKVKEIYQ